MVTLYTLSAALTQSLTLDKTLAPILRIVPFTIFLYGVIKTLQNQLSLYQAIVLLFLFHISLPAWHPRPNNNFKDYVVTWILFLGFAAYVSWALFILVRGKDFGPFPECNESTVVVLFWVIIPATANWLRIVWMICFGSLAFFLFFLLLISIIQLCEYGKETPWIHYSGEYNVSSNDQRSPMAKRVAQAGQLLASRAVPISWLELTIKRNHFESLEFNWNFANTMLLILFIFEIIMVLIFFLEKIGPTNRTNC